MIACRNSSNYLVHLPLKALSKGDTAVCMSLFSILAVLLLITFIECRGLVSQSINTMWSLCALGVRPFCSMQAQISHMTLMSLPYAYVY